MSNITKNRTSGLIGGHIPPTSSNIPTNLISLWLFSLIRPGQKLVMYLLVLDGLFQTWRIYPVHFRFCFKSKGVSHKFMWYPVEQKNDLLKIILISTPMEFLFSGRIRWGTNKIHFRGVKIYWSQLVIWIHMKWSCRREGLDTPSGRQL